MGRLLRTCSLVAVALILLAGCERGNANRQMRSVAAGRIRIESVRSIEGFLGRSLIACPAGPCIVLHFPPKLTDPLDLTTVLEADTDSTADDGELFFEEGNRWCTTPTYAGDQSTFNCCTFAVGDLLGLTTHDWIAPNPSPVTAFTVPMQVVLDSYFQLQRVYPGPDVDWEAAVADVDLQEGDVLCYVRTQSATPEFIHVGKVVKKDGQNWVVSKLGKGPIVAATIKATGREFSGEFDEVRVYRAKPARVKL